ncbi:MAG: transposase, partial [Chloroflexi bacterium]|nr:transposase [Chloroflexota bacterium]
MAPLLPKPRGSLTIPHRQALNALLYVAKEGCTWRGLPERFGNWHTVYVRVNRWARRGGAGPGGGRGGDAGDHGGFTDSRVFRNQEVVAYGFSGGLTSPSLARTVHGNNERITLESFRLSC